MTDGVLARLERVAVRDVWPHEALDFTVWLEKNLDLLAEEIDLDIDTDAAVRREQAAGRRSVDLTCSTSDGRRVVIENQFATTDYDHLGRLLFYAVHLQADVAIWIAEQIHDEHRSVAEWLAAHTPLALYLVELSAVRIADSPFAASFSLVVGPSDEARGAAATAAELTEDEALVRAHKGAVVELDAEKEQLLQGANPETRGHLESRIHRDSNGVTIVLVLVAGVEWLGVRLWIGGRSDPAAVREVYDRIFARRDAVEQALGGEVEWAPNEDRKSAAVRFYLPGGGVRARGGDPDAVRSHLDAFYALGREAIRVLT